MDYGGLVGLYVVNPPACQIAGLRSRGIVGKKILEQTAILFLEEKTSEGSACVHVVTSARSFCSDKSSSASRLRAGSFLLMTEIQVPWSQLGYTQAEIKKKSQISKGRKERKKTDLSLREVL